MVQFIKASWARIVRPQVGLHQDRKLIKQFQQDCPEKSQILQASLSTETCNRPFSLPLSNKVDEEWKMTAGLFYFVYDEDELKRQPLQCTGATAIEKVVIQKREGFFFK